MAIEVPQFHGIAPQLSIAYNSAAGNSFLGPGWELTGFPTIERASPGRGAARFSQPIGSDVYLYNGEELVPSTTLGGTHATKRQSYLRIARVGDVWTVTQRDGTALTFEKKMYVSSRISRWGLTQVRDTHGNTVNYSWYCEPSGIQYAECYPSSVSYGPTTITIYRESRPDPQSYATGNNLGKTNFRLKSILVDNAGSHLRAYKVGYVVSARNARSLLRSAQQYGWDVTISSAGDISGGSFLPPSLFTVTELPSGLSTGMTVSNTPGITLDTWQRSEVYTEDFNGDGRADFLLIARLAGNNSRAYLLLANATGGFLNARDISAESGMTSSFWTYAGVKVTGDFNGDGFADLLVGSKPSSSGFEQVYRLLGSASGAFSNIVNITNAYGLSTNVWTYAGVHVADFNGDGKGDLLLQTVQGTFAFNYVLIATTNGDFGTALEVTNSYGMTWDRWQGLLTLGDFNGDGRTDLLLRHQQAYLTRLLLANPAGGFSSVVDITTIQGLTGQRWLWADLIPGDFNGDGKTDLLLAPAYQQVQPYVLLFANGLDATSAGVGTIAFDPPVDITNASGMNYNRWQNATIFGGDFNGDGATDLIVRSAQTNTNVQDPMLLLFSNGNGFQTALDITAQYGMSASDWIYADFRVADFDGDGDDDLFRHSYYAAQSPNLPQQILKGNGVGTNLLTGIDNGLGGKTDVIYAPSSAWANTNNPPKTQTVTKITVTAQNGRGSNVQTTQYSYSLGKWDGPERRHLGFGLVTATDGTGAYTKTNFYQAPEYRSGEVKEVSQWNASNGQMARSYRTVAAPMGGAPWVTNLTQQDDYEYNGDATFRQATKVFHYDAYGNADIISDLGETSVTTDDRTTTLFGYPNTGAYIVSLPAVESVYDGPNSDGPLLAETRHYYDSGALGTPPLRGDETKTERWLNTAPGFVPQTFSYDGFGNQTSATDGLSHSTTVSWPGVWGLYPVTETNALGHQAVSQWHQVCGTRQSLTDPNSAVTTWSFDQLCRPRFENRPNGLVKAWEYNSFGTTSDQHIAEILVNGSEQIRSRKYFDGAGREWRRFDNVGAAVDTEYDSRGLIAWVTAPYGNGELPKFISRSYDALRRMTQETLPDGSTRRYYFGDWRVTRCDQLSKPMTQFKDAFQQVKSVREYEGIACGEAPPCTVGTNCFDTTIQYDKLGRRTRVISAMGAISTTTYDSLGRRTGESDADRGAIIYQYDNDGSLTQRTNASGNERGYSYDALHRMTSKWVGGPSTVVATYRYDEAGHGFGVGRRTSVSSPTGNSSVTYDVTGNTVIDQRTIGVYYPTSYTAQHRFDPLGRETSTTYPDGEVVGRTYDVAGRLKTVGGYVLNATYDARGNLAARQLGNGVAETISYDPNRFWISNVTSTLGATSVLNLSVQRNLRGEVTNRTNTASAMSDNWTYGYDDRGRLTSATNQLNSAWSKLFAYDGAGRMTFQTGVGALNYPAAGVVPQNGPATINGIVVAYDMRGNAMQNFGGGYADYDPWEDRVSQLNGVRYYYDADGERVDVVSGTSTHYFANLYERNANSGISTNYILFNGALVARKRAGVVHYYHGDQIGSVAAMTDSVGQVALRKTYSPYGGVLLETGGLADAFGIAGQRLDINGLYHMGARELTPMTGIFISPDPSDTPDTLKPVTLNRYAYANNSPTNLLDPTGFSAERSWLDGIAEQFAAFVGWDTHSEDANYRAASTQQVREISHGLASARNEAREDAIDAWNAPNHVIGISGAVIGYAAGKAAGTDPKWTVLDGGKLEVTNVPHFVMPTAITLSPRVKVYGVGYDPWRFQPDSNTTLRYEEDQHAAQARTLGPGYFPAHIAFGVAALLTAGNWHGSANLLEQGPHSSTPQPWPAKKP